MMRIGIAALVGGIVLFVWAYISWMVIQWHGVYGMPEQESVAQAIVDTEAESGMYWVPEIDREMHAALSPEDLKAARETVWEQTRQGPAALILYKKDGVLPLWLTLTKGFVIEVLVAAVAAILLSMAAPALPGFVKRVAFVLLLGVFMIVGANLMNWNYLYYPFRFTMVTVAEGLVAALLLGVVLAIIIRPGAGYDDAADFPPDAAE